MTPRQSTATDRRPTLATLAQALGVSRMTVSNAYNRPDQLSPALRERILAAAEEIGYAGPNPVARTLSRGTTGSIGLVIDAPLTDAFTESATLQFLHGVAAGCEERGVGLSLVPRIVGRDAELVHTALVDGFVLYCMGESDPRLDAVRERRLPYVLIDHQEDPKGRRVNIDDRGGARAVAEHLVALGHRRFAVVVGYDQTSTTALEEELSSPYQVSIERLAGYREALEPAGVDWAEVPLASGPRGYREAGHVAGRRLLDRPEPPTAVLALTDLLAFGVMDAAAERGVPVPDGLSVVGFDDIPEAAVSSPPLTTVRQPHFATGAEAVRLLLDDRAPRDLVLPTELVPRASTAPPPRKDPHVR
jgi:DNA-binding LacI/PurR family transcriptional regulator